MESAGPNANHLHLPPDKITMPAACQSIFQAATLLFSRSTKDKTNRSLQKNMNFDGISRC